MNAAEDLGPVALVGFGEAGSILGEDLARLGVSVVAYDILLDKPATRAAMQAKITAAGVRVAPTLAEAVAGARLIISAVTASSAGDVARGSAATLVPGQVFLDINSVSPAARRANAEAVQSAGAHYVEAAVMAAVPPQRLAVPMLLGGRHAPELAERLRGLGMNVTAVSEEVGIASAIKMCRSIVIKGLEALVLECLLAARRFSAEEQVLASLDQTFPQMGWSGRLPDYLISRVAEHGRRRAAELREVARTLRDTGVEPVMASAIAERQQWLADRMAESGLAYRRDEPFSWRKFVDSL